MAFFSAGLSLSRACLIALAFRMEPKVTPFCMACLAVIIWSVFIVSAAMVICISSLYSTGWYKNTLPGTLPCPIGKDPPLAFERMEGNKEFISADAVGFIATGGFGDFVPGDETGGFGHVVGVALD